MDSSEYKSIISMYEKCFELLVNISNTQNTIVKMLDKVQYRLSVCEEKIQILEEKGANYAI